MKPIKPDFMAIEREIREEQTAASAPGMRKMLAAAAVVTPAAVMMAAPAAEAQSIDYGSLEMLFGEPVTTSATGAPQRASETPVSMEIISAADIADSGATDIQTLLSRVSGVSVQKYNRNTADVAVRGYNQSWSPRLLVLVNGRQVYIDYYGFMDWETLPVQLDEIRQIEVVKGPNTALFGFNAVGGVVNIITFNPLNDDADKVTVRVSDDGSSQGSVVTSFKPHEKVGVRLSAGGFTADEFDGLAFAEEENTKMAYSGEVAIQVAPKVQVFVEGTYSDVSEDSRTISIQPSLVDFTTDSLRGAIEAEGAFGLLKVNVYQNNIDARTEQASGSVAEVDSSLQVIKIEDLFKVGADHTFRVAGEYRISEMTMAAVGSTFDDEYTVLSGSGMWNWAISDTLSSTLALRADMMEYTGDSLPDAFLGGDRVDGDTTEYSYNAGLVWKATDKDTLKFQAARGVQTPSLLDLWNSPDISPSYVQNFGVDYDRSLDFLSGGFSASLFHQINEDMRALYYSPELPGLPITATWGDSSMTGLELALDGTLGDSFAWEASYMYLEVEDDPKADFIDTFGAENVPVNYEESTPASEVKLGASYSVGDWRLSAHSRYVSDVSAIEQPTPNAASYRLTDIDSYISLDLRAAYQIQEGVVLSFEGQDLTNDGDIQVPGGAIESQYRLSLSVDF